MSSRKGQLAFRLNRDINQGRIFHIISQIRRYITLDYRYPTLDSLYKSTIDLERNDLLVIIKDFRDRSARENWSSLEVLANYIKRQQLIEILKLIQDIQPLGQRSGFRSLDKYILEPSTERSPMSVQTPLSFECSKKCWQRFERKARRHFQKRILKDNEGLYWYIVAQRQALQYGIAPLFVRLRFTWCDDIEKYGGLRRAFEVARNSARKSAAHALDRMWKWSLGGAAEWNLVESNHGSSRMVESTYEAESDNGVIWSKRQSDQVHEWAFW